jgi:ATP-dependent Clp protease ATP-binding subunit ClpA
MTSNAGSQFRDNLMGFGKTDGEASRDKATKALSEFLRPEFISRVDEVVHFAPLSKADYADIAVLMLTELVEPLRERGISFTWAEDVPAYFADKAFGGKRGARDLRNAIRREAEDVIAMRIVERCHEGVSAVSLAVENGKLAVHSL